MKEHLIVLHANKQNGVTFVCVFGRLEVTV
jgi:hypothetical protein